MENSTQISKKVENSTQISKRRRSRRKKHGLRSFRVSLKFKVFASKKVPVFLQNSRLRIRPLYMESEKRLWKRESGF